jgi:hypothetical protein
MKLAEQFELLISDEKLMKYLLSGTQTKSTDKAKLFSLFGYNVENASILKDQLKEIASEREVESISENEYGIFYVVSDEIKTPSGKMLLLQTVWHVLDGSTTARFVTSYPKNK